MAAENEIPAMLQFMFGESAGLARLGASARLLLWSKAMDEWLAERQRKNSLGTYNSSKIAWRRLLPNCGLRVSEVCAMRLNDIDTESRNLFIRNSKERKDRIAYMSDTAALAVQQYLAIRPIQDPVHIFPTQLGVMHPRSLQKRLVQYRKKCGVPVTAQRLRHTFTSQMLTAGMPVSSLQRYRGHEHLDTTMIYAEVSDPLLRQDYYQGIAAPDPTSVNLSTSVLGSSHQNTLRQLVKELKSPGLVQSRHDEILDKMQQLLETED